jgi:hypothetical protein
VNDLWPGAEVRLRAGARAVVVDPGRYVKPGTLLAVASDVPYAAPEGVLVQLESAERIDVPRDELELVWPEHPCRGEPDAGHAQWLLDTLDNWQVTYAVSAFVPRTCEAVACVLHPVLATRVTSPPGTWPVEARRESLRWEQVVTMLDLDGRKALFDALWGEESLDLQRVAYEGHGRLQNPDEGQLDAQTMRALVDELANATTTPNDVFYLVWEGWGGDPWDRFPAAAHVPDRNLSGRESRLLRGPLEGALQPIDPNGFQGETMDPMIWWPADRAWVVHSEIDFAWTLVAGSGALVDALLMRDDLEVIRTTFDAEPDGAL